MTWDLELGATESRTAIQKKHLGSSSRGISAPSSVSGLNNIMLWWRPERGEEFGYIDGWADEGQAFYFAGTGQEGDQTFSAPYPENGRVRDHLANGDRVRLLRYVAPNRVRYMGEVRLDLQAPYRWVDGYDRLGNTRRIIQFRFLPVGPVLRSPDDPVPTSMSSEVVATRLPPLPGPPSQARLEALRRPSFRVLVGARAVIVRRKELILVHAFSEWLESARNLTATGLRIPYAPERRDLRADLFIPAVRVLIEAKSTTARVMMRTAIGQLLDYARWVSPRPRLCVLTPSRPPDDMLELVASLTISAVWAEGGKFVTADPDPFAS